jgi:hypothetical protein
MNTQAHSYIDFHPLRKAWITIYYKTGIDNIPTTSHDLAHVSLESIH